MRRSRLSRLQEPMLKDALKISSGLTEAEIEARFAAYMPKKGDVGIRGQATAQLATEYEQGLRDYVQRMKTDGHKWDR